jgi:two-component system chemotaxis response regulator CheY
MGYYPLCRGVSFNIYRLRQARLSAANNACLIDVIRLLYCTIGRIAAIRYRSSPTEPAVPEEFMALRIMIVDDALFMRRVLRGIVEEEGWTVIGEAVDGEDAVRKYREYLPDITTMDIVMPLKSGIEALSEIIAMDKNAKVVICSAMGQQGLLEEAQKAGAQGYIIKPFDPPTVKNVIRTVAGI